MANNKGAAQKGRSSLEDLLLNDLEERGVWYEYESFRVPYRPTKTSYYTPDLFLENGIIIEAKGHFGGVAIGRGGKKFFAKSPSKERTKMIDVMTCHPDLDIRFIFSKASTKLHKGAKSTYGEWATKNGFKWAEGQSIPDAWLAEPRNEKSIKAVEALRGHS